ncbi:PREDICTED: uncharacterized protein LOC105361030 [Ceratosolen solmsi marchali]|uniref:Uncharacterized protein LOC105361030 n=1 Tax=Ceratosolen solmsi marchali TaxID=326594 RepID=A0AAJ6YE62_9HYME|nr:PREDICTED: uncharacterized protein LOC105361030 [Ceratosolen solmsi marchali]
MAGPKSIFVLVALGLIVSLEVLAIQNDRTRSRSSRDEEIILSASAYGERTSDDLLQHHTQGFHRTQDILRLESSRSVDDLDADIEETRYPSLGDAVAAAASADEPIIDALTASKLIEHIDGNQIEVKAGKYFRNIVPTKSESLPGEGWGAPQGQRQDGPSSEPREQPVRASQTLFLEKLPRQARREPTRIYSEHAPPPLITQDPNQSPRQANTDIQDIITGIVKLLNGKVNVAVNSAKPVRPVQSTRINNRGPPRISDVLPLPPDFDTPGMNPPPPPPNQPSTYETPPAPSAPSLNQLPPEPPITSYLNGIPLPETVVSQGNRPWNRPSRPGTRQPLPPYMPLPEREHPESDKNNAIDPHGLGNKIDHDDNKTRLTENKDNKPSNHDQSNRSKPVATQRPQITPTRKYQSTLKTEGAMAENTLVLGGVPLQPQPIPTSNEHDDDREPMAVVPLKANNDHSPILNGQLNNFHADKNKLSKVSSPGANTKAVFQTTLSVETSSSVQVIEATSTMSMLEPSLVPAKQSHFSESSPTDPAIIASSVASLEPSILASVNVDVDPTTSSSIPTEELSTSLSKTTNLSKKATGQSITGTTATFSKSQSSVYSYRPRPGIVLDDTLDYTGSQGIVTHRPFGPPRHPSNPDTFDVVVSAIQGPAGSGTGEVRVPVNVGHGGGSTDDILTSSVEGQGFVSIDGKRTYLNLFDSTEAASPGPSNTRLQPTKTQATSVVGTGFAVPQSESTAVAAARPSVPARRPTFHRRPTQPPVRIDTCIVGDSSTCDSSQHEACATVQGVSACHCKPGFARITHSLPCKKIVSIVVSIRVDKIYDRKMIWNKDLDDNDSEFYQTLAYEANRAIESAMSMTPFSDEYVGSSVNNVYQGDISQGQGGVFVNATLKLAYEPRTARQGLAGDLQKHLLGVIQRRYNNIGNSALHVDGPAGSISNLQDLDECASSELNDCHSSATCANTWGGFTCTCNAGFKDPHKSDQSTAGRTCLSCSTSHCNNRGTCSYQADQMHCSCTGNYYGAQCEVDGEVLGVAIGASVAALIIIVLTLVCLVMWSRRWSQEQKTISPVYGYVQGGLPGTLPATLARVGSVGTLASVKQGPPTNLPPYMWAQVADHLATANVYATEPMGPTRPSSAMFGYPTLSLHGTLPPVPLPRLQGPPRARQRHQPEPDSSDSEPQDKDRADLIPQSNFQVPRPKSRSSLANQSGIYYDVEYDQGDARHLSKNNIPMSTYSMAPYYRT